MIDLKELKRLAEGADAKNNPFDDSGEMYLKALAPVVVLQLIKEHQEMREALESIASKNKPRHDDAKYWQAISREQCAEVLANDTRIARQTLDGVSK